MAMRVGFPDSFTSDRPTKIVETVLDASDPSAIMERWSRSNSIDWASTMFASCHRRASPAYRAIAEVPRTFIDRAVTWMGLDEDRSAPLGWGLRSLYVVFTLPSA